MVATAAYRRWRVSVLPTTERESRVFCRLPAHDAVCVLMFNCDHSCDVFNLGTGTPRSVLEVMHAFERACGHPVKHVLGPRRSGDQPAAYAVADKVWLFFFFKQYNVLMCHTMNCCTASLNRHFF
jgi:UDP-glucose 4-epimerase